MPSFLQYLSVTSLVAARAFAASPDEWRNRTIYQVLTDRFARSDNSTTAPCDLAARDYCGGTWKGIEYKLDYISDMGFDAIWISPITAQIPKAFHGYYQTNLYEINDNFGSKQDLIDLSNALHARNMYLMVDVVTNHFGSTTNWPDTIDYPGYFPFDSQSFFHDYCAIDYDNQTSAEICWLYTNLPDVRTEDQNVVDAYSEWISELVANYSIDGLRIDSVKDVDKASMPPFCQAAGVYCLGELSNGNADYSYPYQQVLNGGGIINYPIYDAFNQTFIHNFASTQELAYNIYLDRNLSVDSNLHGTFTENHDQPRLAWYNSDISLAANAIAWIMFTDGIPIIYEGQEQHLDGADDPYNREAMWLEQNGSYNSSAPLVAVVQRMISIRKWIIQHSSEFTHTQTQTLNYSDNQISLRKDVLRSILTFAGVQQASGMYTTDGAEFSAGTTVVDLVSCRSYTADSSGEVTADIGGGQMVILLEADFLTGIGICGH